MNGIQALQSIPFGNLIGGPLTAAVQAQTQAAMTCVNFIQSVGLKTVNNETVVNEVTFKYSKLNDAGTPATFSLTVPLLAIVPIPYLRIDEVLIDFSAKLTDVATAEQSTSFGLDLTVQGGWKPVSFKATASYKNDKSSKSSSTQDYCMNVKVRAVQADIPGGLQKILDILESVIKEEAAN